MSDAPIRRPNTTRLSGPLRGNLKSQQRNSETTSNVQEGLSALHFGAMDENTAFERIDFCMKSNAPRTAVIFTDADDFIRHFGEQHSGMTGRVAASLGQYKGLSTTNRNIMIFIFRGGSLSDVLDAYENYNGTAWKVQFEPILKSSTGAITISPPAIGEIRNVINRCRIINGLKVKFEHLDEICKNITKIFFSQNLPLGELMMKLEDIAHSGKVLDKKVCADMLGNEKTKKTALQQLDELIGMVDVKTEIRALRKMLENNNSDDSSLLHHPFSIFA